MNGLGLSAGQGTREDVHEDSTLYRFPELPYFVTRLRHGIRRLFVRSSLARSRTLSKLEVGDLEVMELEDGSRLDIADPVRAVLGMADHMDSRSCKTFEDMVRPPAKFLFACGHKMGHRLGEERD